MRNANLLRVMVDMCIPRSFSGVQLIMIYGSKLVNKYTKMKLFYFNLFLLRVLENFSRHEDSPGNYERL